MELHKAQIEAVEKLLPNIQKGIGGIVYWSMGEGKTRIALEILNRIKFGKPEITLCVCRRKAFGTWRDEIRKVKLNVRVDEFPNKKPFWSKDRPTIWLVSHAMLHKLNLSPYPIQFIIFDELYLYSNHKSKRSIAAMAVCRESNGRCIGLSGTIMPAKDTLAIWGQTRTVGLSHYLSRTTSQFYSDYKRSFLVNYGRGQINQWTDKPKAKERILERLQPYVHIHFPKSKRSIVESFHEFPLTLKQIKIIKALKDEYYISDEEQSFELELRSALELIIKVSQIANGWCKDKTGNFAYFPSNKLDALCANLEESYANNVQRIVWCHFKKDIDVIQDNLDFETLKMSGSHKFDSDKWQSNKFPVVLATMGSGASINDFKNVQHASVFSQTFKFLDQSQSLARTNRYDSSHQSCQYSYYLAKGTFDKHIYNILKSTGNVEQQFIKQGILKQWLLSPAS